MQQKYYAVQKGRTPGIYLNWEDCKKQVEGYKGAKYKSFTNAKDAADFMNNIVNTDIDTDESGRPITDEKTAVAYVDGSYNVETKQFSYGMVMFHNGNEKHFSQRVDDRELAEMRNVAGEIKGAEAAMKYAVDNNVEKLVIYHDYEGIASWCLGYWKTNKAGTIAYKEFYDKIKNSVNITFVKVKGHSNDTYNDLADALAKQAVLLK
jgi:ribonuclease HI